MNTLDGVKKQAKILQDFLRSKPNDDAITNSSCLQAIAKINNHKDWNTMKAILASTNITNMEPEKTVSTLEKRVEELEFYVKALAEELDALIKRVNVSEPYVDEYLRGIDPNPEK